ncbi:MAG TPA: 8-amino-7-oxononanoate synthase [Candidatus Acidoferrales bacterium]|nr:8-amino-7-oxononanoate synthase [Candidatus Acidoferrales bacterium]
MREIRDSALARRMAAEIESLREHGQLRALEHPAGINLCSNDYLGLATDPRLKNAVADAIARTAAVGSTGSRLLSGNAREWEQLETTFARFAGTEAALYFGSGYAANIGLLSSVFETGDVIFSDSLNHASLIDGIRLSRATKVIYPHGDVAFLENALREHSHHPGAKVIVTETVFSMEGDVAPLDSLLRLARDCGAELILDEAHATGVLGPQGRGVGASVGATREIFAIVHTCGKALASAGASVCCSELLRQYLVNRARTFIFSTAMPPYFAGQICAALDLSIGADRERAELRSLADLLRGELRAAGVAVGASETQIVPVMCGTNEAALHVASVLQETGFAVRAIRPPTVPAGTARVRLSLTAKITPADVLRLSKTIRAAFDSLPSHPATILVR